MFGRKYIFETRATRYKRIAVGCIAIAFFLFCSFVIFCAFLPYYGFKENERSDNAFYKRAPDLIAVYTGDVGRISQAIKMAKESDHSQILISGVNVRNTLKTFLDSYEQEELESKMIEIDYFARNTYENVIYTLRYLRMQKVLGNVLIISSDYHIFRIQMLLSRLRSSDDNYKFYYQGIPKNYLSWRSMKILFKEGVKVLKTAAFLVTWDEENIPKSE